MADWTDPTTWRDAGKFGPMLTEISKALADARKRGTAQAELDSIEAIATVLQGHQKSLLDVSHVAGKLVAYTTSAHEQRLAEVDSIRELIKSVRQLEKSVAKLTKRVQKLEDRAARAGAR